MILIVTDQIQYKSAARAAQFGVFFSNGNLKVILLLHFSNNQLKWLF